MTIRLSSSDACFQAGISALQHHISVGLGANVRIHALYFPDMRYLLAWSQKPLLPIGDIVIIAGSEKLISILADIVDPDRVLLSGGGESIPSLTERLYQKLSQQESGGDTEKPEILITPREMSYMWAFMRGHPRQSDSKRDYGIRRAVMAKIGAEDQISLLIRFRLLLFLDSCYLLKHVRMRNSAVSASQRQGRWLYLQELRDHGSQIVGNINHKN